MTEKVKPKSVSLAALKAYDECDYGPREKGGCDCTGVHMRPQCAALRICLSFRSFPDAMEFIFPDLGADE